MTTIRQIVIDAFRESGVVQVGLTPEAEEFDEGLRKLQSFITSLYGYEIGVPLEDVAFGTEGVSNSYGLAVDDESWISSSYLPSNVRLVSNLSTAKSIYLEPNPEDGARVAVVDANGNFSSNALTIYGNGRKIAGATSAVLNTDGVSRQWMYRADLAQWVQISDLSADDQSPFPTEFDDFLITWLAIRLNPRYQEQTAPETLRAYQENRKKFVSRYSQKQEVDLEDALIRNSLNGNGYYSSRFTSRAKFNRGFTN